MDRVADLDVGSLIAVLAAGIMLKIGFAIKNLLPTLEHPVVILVMFVIYLLGFALLVAGVSNLDMTKWGQPFAFTVLAVLLVAFVLTFVNQIESSQLQTDAILFARYSVDMLLAGQNPYAHTMEPGFSQYLVDDRYVTYRISGDIVTSLSYPALSVLVFVPQALLGISNLNITTVVVLMLVLVFLVYESPDELALLPFVVIFADPNLTYFSYGGVFDIIWVLPILLGMKFWTDRRLRLAAICVGAAFAVKQIPWFVGPFLAVWLYLDADTYRDFLADARTTITYGFAAFLLPNVPFIVWAPVAWVKSVVTPVAGGTPMVKQGVGLTLISAGGYYQLPKTFFSIALLLGLVSLLVVYALYFERLRWAAWLAPAFVLWLNYRSLQNYFVYFVPIAYYAVICRYRAAEASSGWMTQATDTGESTPTETPRDPDEATDVQAE